MLQVVERIVDEVRGAWRYRWIALTVAWGVTVIGWLFVFAIPDMYEARARVYVDTRTPLRPLLEGVAADPDFESQILIVRQALLGAPNLARVAGEAGLLESTGTSEQRRAMISEMAKRIEIELEPAIVRDPRIPNTFYRINYRNPSRDKALRVVELLLNAFVTDTFGTTHEGAVSANTFLESQLEQYRERLTAAENALADFKRRNIGMVPGEEGGFFQRLDREESNVQRVEAALRVALARKEELSRQLRGEVPFLPSSQQSPNARGTRSGPAPVDTASRIQETQARLDELLLQYTEKHPDVIAAKQALVELKARQVEEIEAVRRGDPGAAAIAGAFVNPVHQNIQIQLHDADLQIAALRGELSDFRRNVAELRLALESAPQAEAEFTRLTRDYDVTQAQYNSLLQRHEQARVSEDAQGMGIVDFQIIDPPTASSNPVFPSRPLLIVGVLMFAVLAGVGVTWLVSQMRPVFLHGTTLAQITGLPVIGVVSMAWLERHRTALKRDYLRYAAATVLLFLTTAVVIVMHAPVSHAVQQLVS
jgi:polysaccharide chain length determinant protein (PEP-CTERM system associated)